MEQKSKTTAILLAFFLGGLGAHWFYLGNKKRGFIYLVLFLVGLATVVVAACVLLLSIIDIIKFLKCTNEEFAREYCKNTSSNTLQQPTNAPYQPTNPPYQPDSSSTNTSSWSETKDFFFCGNCGAKLKIGTRFCPSCGQEQNN